MINLINYIYNFIKSIEEKSHNSFDARLRMKRSIQLDDYSCAAHAINSISQFYNSLQSISFIKKSLGTTPAGTDTGPILKYLISLGLKIKINTKADVKDIQKALMDSNPVLITIDHWLVIYGISSDKIWIIDSNKKRVFNTFSKNEFLKRWDDNWIAIISE